MQVTLPQVRRPFFSEDVLRLRLCSGTEGYILLAAPGSRPPTPAVNIGASSGDRFFSCLTPPAPCAFGRAVLL